LVRPRDLGGQDLAGETPGEDRLAVHRVTPARENGSAGCSNPWSRGRLADVIVLRGGGASGRSNGTKDRLRCDAGHASAGRAVRRSRLPAGENLWRCKAHERPRHETRPGGLRAEQSVKRLRKPEGAAQPELVASV
jgi:hypothetical protein